MTTIKLSIHSFVDLITNSSTEMYIDYSGSVEPCKEMINGIFKAFGIEKTCDEVFDLKLENEDDECCPAMLHITAKDPSLENIAKLIKNFLESGQEKEFMS